MAEIKEMEKTEEAKEAEATEGKARMMKLLHAYGLCDYGTEENSLARFLKKHSNEWLMGLPQKDLVIAARIAQLEPIGKYLLRYDYSWHILGMRLELRDCSSDACTYYGMTNEDFCQYQDDLMTRAREIYGEEVKTIVDAVRMANPDSEAKKVATASLWYKIAMLKQQLEEELECRIVEESPAEFQVRLRASSSAEEDAKVAEYAYTRTGLERLIADIPDLAELYQQIKMVAIGSGIIAANYIGAEAKVEERYGWLTATIDGKRYKMNQKGLHLYALRNFASSYTCDEEYCETFVLALDSEDVLKEAGYTATFTESKGCVCLRRNEEVVEIFGMCRNDMIRLIDFLMDVQLPKIQLPKAK